MAHPYHHAISSARKFGGKPEDYQDIHDWFDQTKSALNDMRHRAMRHHSEGIFWCEERFGVTVTNSDGKKVPTRLIGEQHVTEDMGWVPTMKDWLMNMNPQGWMYHPGEGRKLAYDIEKEKLDREPINQTTR
jgi:hypothetical protein